MSRTSLEQAAIPPRRRRQGTAGGFGPRAHYRAIKSLFRRRKHPQVRAKGHLVIPNDIALPAVSSQTCSGRSSSFGAAVIQNARSPTLAPFFATCFLSLVFLPGPRWFIFHALFVLFLLICSRIDIFCSSPSSESSCTSAYG